MPDSYGFSQRIDPEIVVKLINFFEGKWAGIFDPRLRYKHLLRSKGRLSEPDKAPC